VVLLSVALGRPFVAEMLHAPLGVLGFAVSCAIVLLLARRRSAPAIAPAHASVRSRLPAPALCFATALLVPLDVARPDTPLTIAPLTLRLPVEIRTAPLPLTDAEQGLFRRFAGALPDKRRFDWNGHRGTLLVAYSASFRAHHPPEICMASAGIHVDAITDVADGRDRFRFASLDGGTRSALYWYQSPSGTRADILDRALAEISGRERRWVQVSLLLDEPPTVAREGRDLFALVRAAVATALDEVPR
jgi:exosortase O